MSTTGEEILVHATCVSLGGQGLLLRGPSASGKSDLALRLIAEAGARLVADDQCRLARHGGALVATAPAAIAGRIEARGLGVMALPAAGEAVVALVADLVPGRGAARLPEPATAAFLGLAVRRCELDPFEAGATAKLCLALAPERAAIMPASGAPAGDHGPPGGERDAMTSGTGEAEQAARLPVVLVTGMSGAGRSTTLKALEDIGYEAIDNLPLHLLSEIVRAGRLSDPVAVGVDIRSRDFAVEPFLEALTALAGDPALALTLVFVDCEDEVLRRRYTETRRRHPLAQGRPLSDGIAAERRLVAPLRARADITLDTSTLSVPDLRRMVAARLALAESPGMAVFLVSFSYRNGLPREADLVFDARFLRNPNYVEALRPLTGREPAVADYVAADADYPAFIEGATAMLARLIPRYEAEGKSYLTIAVGCSGGRHRSVAVVERIAGRLRAQGRDALVTHRELGAQHDAEDARAADSR